MKQRILYIDNLKAFAIFLVVVGHVYFFTWSNHVNILWFRLISLVNMPLFFFLSGLFAKNKMSLKSLRRKVVQLLLPTIVLGSIYAYLHNGMEELVFGQSHFGYWFLLALFYTFCIFYVRGLIISKLSAKRQWLKNVVEVLFLGSVWLILKACMKIIPQELSALFCLEQLANFVPFFWAGFLAQQNKGIIKMYIGKYNEYFYAISFGMLSVLFYMFYYSDVALPGVLSKVVSICGIYVLVVFFRAKSNSIANKTQQVLSWIGTHTLEIYVLQYFFLPDSYKLSDIGLGGVNSLLFAILESLLCIIFCIATIKLLSINKYLRFIFFGK